MNALNSIYIIDMDDAAEDTQASINTLHSWSRKYVLHWKDGKCLGDCYIVDSYSINIKDWKGVIGVGSDYRAYTDKGYKGLFKPVGPKDNPDEYYEELSNDAKWYIRGMI